MFTFHDNTLKERFCKISKNLTGSENKFVELLK